MSLVACITAIAVYASTEDSQNIENMPTENIGMWTDSDSSTEWDSPERYEEDPDDRTPIITNDVLIADNFRPGKGTIGVYLVDIDDYPYAAIQGIVRIPEGMKITEVKKGPRTLASKHSLSYKVTDTVVNFVFFSTKNATFGDEAGSLLDLSFEAEDKCGNLTIDNILASDARQMGYILGFDGGINEANDVTGITDIYVQNGLTRFFTLNGLEISNPLPGQILVRLENGKATKIML